MVHVDVHQTLDVMTLNVAELAFADLSCIQHQQANINISVDNLLTEFVIVWYPSCAIEIEFNQACLDSWVFDLDILSNLFEICARTGYEANVESFLGKLLAEFGSNSSWGSSD